jgi:hypothetical protein
MERGGRACASSRCRYCTGTSVCRASGRPLACLGRWGRPPLASQIAKLVRSLAIGFPLDERICGDSLSEEFFYIRRACNDADEMAAMEIGRSPNNPAPERLPVVLVLLLPNLETLTLLTPDCRSGSSDVWDYYAVLLSALGGVESRRGVEGESVPTKTIRLRPGRTP